MLTFRDSENVRNEYKQICENIEREYDGCECDFACVSGTLVARIFDDSIGYTFTYPLPVQESFSLECSLKSVADFCKREGISEIITGVPIDKLPSVIDGVRHAQIHAIDTEGRLFAVEIKTELSMLEGEVEAEFGDICLSTPDNRYAESYMSLVNDREHNRYYGYELTDDIADATPEVMISELRREIDSHIALTLFATDDGEFVGEGVIYALDGRGGGEISFRVKRALCGRGYGKRLLVALLNICEEIGLLRVYARVHRDNTRSLALLRSSGFTEVSEDGDTVYFAYDV